jgi:hypothetical protein
MKVFLGLLVLLGVGLTRAKQPELVSPSPDATVEKWDMLLKQRPEMEKSMREHFSSLDTNNNHELDFDELKAELSPREYHMTKNFDMDHSDTVSLQEYLRGPLYLHHLEARPAIADAFWKLADEATKDSDVPDMRYALEHAASGISPQSGGSPSLVEVADGVTMDPAVAAKIKDMSDAELARYFKLGPADAQGVQGLSRADTMRFLQTKGFLGSALSAVTGGMAGASSASGSAAGPEPYKTKYGVPSVVNEGCVMCQYVSQLMQRELYTKLIDSPTDDIGDATPLQVKKTNALIGERKNGRGLCRLVVEDTLTEFCDPDSLPELFWPYCKDFWPRQWLFAKCLFYQLPIETWCLETQDCPLASYMGWKTAVHLPVTSLRLNNGRGKCAMAGGVHPPKGGLMGSMACAASNALTG